MKHIYYKATLVYYDGPQIFEARDKIGGHYIAMSVASPRDPDDFLAVGVSPEELRRFHIGDIDLRELLLGAEESEWYRLDPNFRFDEPIAMRIQKGYSSDNNEMLPSAGFYMHGDPTDEDIIREVRERNNSVLQITTEPQESIEGHRMGVSTYTELLQRMQALVQHAYRSLLPKGSPKNMDNKDACSMNVIVPARAGSFQVFLESAKGADMLGDTDLGQALKQLDLFFEVAGDPKKTAELLRNNRGRLGHAYFKFMEFLADHDIGFKYSWAEPSSTAPNRQDVSRREAVLLVEKLSEVNDLDVEIISFEGRVDKVDSTHRTWRLHTDQGRVNGSVREDGPTLNGLEIGARYKFTCEEKTSITERTGTEKRALFLISYEAT